MYIDFRCLGSWGRVVAGGLVLVVYDLFLGFDCVLLYLFNFVGCYILF